VARAQPPQHGFTYIGLLFAIAIIGITLATVGVVWSTEARRDREAQLLFVGDQYRQAIGRYLQAGGVYPQSLDELLEDKRVPLPRRFLRRLYPDPMTGSADWELIQAGDGGIMGVASTSQQQPIKVAGFRLADSTFEKAECYCNWKFIYVARGAGRRRVLPPPTPASAPAPAPTHP
jgi:type II secretory pathway pseudopilin PulG